MLAAADPTRSLLKPEQHFASPPSPKVGEMADVAEKDSQHITEQHISSDLKDDLTQPKESISPSSPQPDSQSPTPSSPVKEGFTTLYQQRQKCELKRLLKHTYPEMKGLGHMVDEEFADLLSCGISPDTAYQGEVHSRCMMFENGAYTTDGTHFKETHLMEGSFQGGNVPERSLTFDSREEGSIAHSPLGSADTNKQRMSTDPQHDLSSEKEHEALAQEENFRVDVKATCKMFEGRLFDTLRDNMDDMFPGRVVISEEEKGTVQKQMRETYQNDTVKRNSPVDITDIADITDQDIGKVYLGISRAKGIFEKGSNENENHSSANDTSTEDETLKTNVKNRAQMFESMPLDMINFQNEAASTTTDEGISKSLASLHNFNVIHSHGILIEATEAAHVKKVSYKFWQDKGPEIEHEEMVMGSIKSILLPILARENLHSLITYLKEDNQGNVEIKNVEVPTHQLPFTVHQDKEFRTTNMVQVIEDMLGQGTCPGKGILIQENGIGSVDTLVYTLFRQERFDSIWMENKMESKELQVLLSRNDATPNPSIHVDASLHESSTNNVKLFQSCTEKGNLDDLKRLQKSSSEEDLCLPTVEGEQHVGIALGSFKVNKAVSATNPDNGESSVRSTKTIPQPLEEDMSANHNYQLPNHKKNEKFITKCENVKTRKVLHSQYLDNMCSENPDEVMEHQAELKNTANDEFSNLQAAIVSLQQATQEAKALQQSIQGKQQDIFPSKLTHDIIAIASENQEISAAGKKGYTEEAECLESSEQQKDREECMKGSVQAALDSLCKSSFNITKGDFKAAMIYRNSGKSYAGSNKQTDMEMGVKQAGIVAPSEENKAHVFKPLPGQVIVDAQQGRGEAGQGHLTNNPTANPPMTTQTDPQSALHNSKKPLGPKPVIPPKPDHLKVNISSSVAILGCATNNRSLNKSQAEVNSAASLEEPAQLCPELKPAQKAESLKGSQHNADVEQSEIGCALFNEMETHKQVSQGHITMEGPEGPKEGKINALEESQRNVPDNMQDVNETHIGFHAALQNLRIKTGQTTAPVKPKRIKMATSSTTQNPDVLQIHTNDAKPKQHDGEHEGQAETKVKMREKRVKGESEGRVKGESAAERRKRLSVHMDDIMRGNTSTAMDIFDKLRKQEELQNILSTVEEMEGNTNQECVRDLREILENVPNWVVSEEHMNDVEKKKIGRSGTVCDPEMMSSMEVAFGDLEKASAAIINLKEQTLSRLMDIEETIKKALLSVSTLKSDSDIAGLSGLFKESMMKEHRMPFSGNIRKISIGSSKFSKAQSLNNLEILRKTTAEEPAINEERSNSQLNIPTPKPRSGSPSSPSFISIQSAARKNTESQGVQTPPADVQDSSPKSETFQTSAALKLCNVTQRDSCSHSNDKRQVSTLEVQTIPKGETVIGTKTIREKYEETDHFGNKFYSSKTSTVVTTQPETKTCFRRQVMSSPATSEINTYPRINTPTFKRDQASL
ncbi:xin actin-binding repeat-containing protein 1 [Brachyhypopomus gauderio]|uniref:xin actin-binding repeat-containing protein 1 n=1 Tax=Brachyhypopomus gauderio TaxID=698409 RepID=UPI00404390C7